MIQHDLQFAIELARDAAKSVVEQYGKVARLTKTHVAATEEAVTEADRNAQRIIVAGLKRRYPTDGIVGEESDTGESITFDCTDPNGRNWVIDPIDGTNNFIAGLGNFAVCIGLLDAGYPVLGVVYDITRDWMYSAAKGHGAWLGNKELRVQSTPITDSSMLMMTSNLLTNNKCPAWATRLLAQTRIKARILGSAALEAVQVAAGVAHGAITVNGKLWDVAAPAAIVLEAGGKVTNFAGEAVFPFKLDRYQGAKVPFVAAAPLALEELLGEIRRNP